MNRLRGSAPSVLLVEDDSTLLAALVECLLREGYRVTTAANGAAAIDASRRTEFDAVVIDVFLPDAGGLGVARAMCQQARGPIHVLFTSALSLPTVRLALEPAPVLFKPFKRRELLDKIREVIDRPPLYLGLANPASPAPREEAT